MTDRPVWTTRIWQAALLAAVCTALTGCAFLQPRPAVPAHARRLARPAAPAVILPFSQSRLRTALTAAGQFAAACDTWSWQQAPAAWLAPLRSLAAPGLAGALARAAAIPAVKARRTVLRQAATAAVTAEQVRDMAPGSVTITVTVRQVITSTAGTTRNDSRLAVTLTPRGAGWAVWDIEPASAGNT